MDYAIIAILNEKLYNILRLCMFCMFYPVHVHFVCFSWRGMTQPVPQLNCSATWRAGSAWRNSSSFSTPAWSTSPTAGPRGRGLWRSRLPPMRSNRWSGPCFRTQTAELPYWLRSSSRCLYNVNDSLGILVTDNIILFCKSMVYCMYSYILILANKYLTNVFFSQYEMIFKYCDFGRYIHVLMHLYIC